MTLKSRRETVHKRIDGIKLQEGKAYETVRNFIKLFLLDKGAIDTISRDETARKVDLILKRSKEFQRFKAMKRGNEMSSKNSR